jgi:ribosomal protein S18 acetylase RimI-like enzyme
MNYTIQYEKNPSADDIQILNDGIMKEHKIKKDMRPLDFFAYLIRDDQAQIVGGCAGDNMYGGLFVGQLWVKEELRGKGYGTKLMSLAEDLAIKSQCRFITVNTFEWEALNFYRKLGFYVEFARHGFDKDSIFYFLRKDLSIQNNKDTKAAFIWIIDILKKLNIPFQIAGGLAAIAHGASRPLEDIDIDIPEEYFPLVKDEVKNFIVYGPNQFKDETWDLMLMTLNYKGQLIDLSGAFYTKVYNKNTKKWQVFSTNFAKVDMKKCFDLDVPVISKDELLSYKKIIARPVDLIDIEQIETSNGKI